MNTFSYTHTRNNLAKILDQADQNHEHIMITRSGQKTSVIMSMDEYESIQETLLLLSSPKNAARMLQSLEDYNNNNFVNGELVD